MLMVLTEVTQSLPPALSETRPHDNSHRHKMFPFLWDENNRIKINILLIYLLVCSHVCSD